MAEADHPNCLLILIVTIDGSQEGWTSLELDNIGCITDAWP